jgi:leader peptidase (prepilin peptidase)/N-methyltransferase
MSSWPQPFLTAYVFAVGAVVGSFLNVLVYRVPRRRSIVRPGSACPACATPIRWYDNIPMVSWLLLRGRCRACAAPISVRYPLVEAVAALMAVITVHRYGLTVAGAEVVVFGWLTLVLGLIDLDHQLLPDVFTYPLIALGVVGAACGGLTNVVDSLIGAAVGAALPTAVILLYRVLRGEEGMGWGDVKYLAAIGATVGVRACLWILVCAAVLGALVGVGLIVAGRGSSRTALPFGTFLALAVLIWLYVPLSWLAWSLW